MRPLVSIITPSLNQGQFIEQTICSVLEQDYAPIEYLLYDGGSTDTTHSVLQRYQDKLHVVIAPDSGQGDAINRGLRAARGEIVAWLNSDDYYLRGAVAAAVTGLIERPACAMVYGEAHYVDAEGQNIGCYPTGPVSRLTEGCYICQPTVFLRRDAVAKVGYLDPTLRYCMDYDLWLRLATRHEIARLPAHLACSRLHPAAKTVAEQLAFHREVVRMTYRRLGATPLPWLYGYADLLVRERVRGSHDGRLAALARRTLSTAATCALALRYHRRLTAADMGVILRRWRTPRAAG